MIDYLKESTFAVKDVVMQAWKVTRENYFSLATLCFLIFLTVSTSTFMAFFMEEVNIVIKFLMVSLFGFCYCIIELFLIKYILKLLDAKDGDILIIETLPTRSEVFRFLLATFYFGLGILVSMLFIVPILYFLLFLLDGLFKYLVTQNIIADYNSTGKIIVQIAMNITGLTVLLAFLKIVFFPFFIIDKNSSAFESIKLSLAVTKGNFLKLLIFFFSQITIQLLVFYLFSIGFWLIFRVLGLFWDLEFFQQYSSLIVVIFTSFLMVPFTTAFLAVAYRKIMNEYKGEEHPDIIHNIV